MINTDRLNHIRSELVTIALNLKLLRDEDVEPESRDLDESDEPVRPAQIVDVGQRPALSAQSQDDTDQPVEQLDEVEVVDVEIASTRDDQPAHPLFQEPLQLPEERQEQQLEPQHPPTRVKAFSDRVLVSNEELERRIVEFASGGNVFCFVFF